MRKALYLLAAGLLMLTLAFGASNALAGGGEPSLSTELCELATGNTVYINTGQGLESGILDYGSSRADIVVGAAYTGVYTLDACEVVTEVPTEVVTEVPTEVPTEVVTEVPTEVPTEVVTEVPTEVPTEVVTEVPTEVVTSTPTDTPTDNGGGHTNHTPTPAPTTPTNNGGGGDHPGGGNNGNNGGTIVPKSTSTATVSGLPVTGYGPWGSDSDPLVPFLFSLAVLFFMASALQALSVRRARS